MTASKAGAFRSALGQTLEALRVSGPLWTASLVLDRIAPVGVLGLWSDRNVTGETLAKQVETILGGWGMSPEHVAIATRHILYADMHGVDSHGCSMLLHYQRLLAKGSLAIAPRIEVISESNTTALVDGGGGLGHVPADAAMQMAIMKCRTAGVGAVAVRNSGHFGAAGSYVSMATAARFIGIATTNTWRPSLVPTFGTEARLGTNPIAFGAPAARNRSFLLDMATTTASMGKLTMAHRKSRSIPDGWALDPKGKTVTDARTAMRHRRMTPLGGDPETGSHKGYGLAAVVEILSSVLPGRTGAESAQDAAVGHFFLVLDPGRFRPQGNFEDDLDTLIDTLHGTARVNASQPVLVAGDPEHTAFAERSRSGIPLSRSVIEDLRRVARAAGVPFLLSQ